MYFESDTVKNDCPIQILRGKKRNIKIFNIECWFILLVLLFVMEMTSYQIKKKALKRTSVLVIFRDFLFSSPRLLICKKSRKSTNKKCVLSITNSILRRKSLVSIYVFS